MEFLGLPLAVAILILFLLLIGVIIALIITMVKVYTTTTVSNPSSTLSNGKIWVGNAQNAPTAVTMSGGATMTNQGVVTLNESADVVAPAFVIKNALGDEVKLVAPAAAFTDYNWTFPTDNGTANQVLTTNGTILSWTTPGLSNLISRFYGMTTGTGNGGTNDYTTTVAVGAAIPFPRDDFLSGGIIRSSTTEFLLPFAGTYKVDFIIQTTELGQWQVSVAGVAVANSTVGNQNPTSGGHLFTGVAFVTTVSNDVLMSVINPAGNSTALTITPPGGAVTHANVQSLVIRRIE